MSFSYEACNACKLRFICSVYPLIKDNHALGAAMIGCRYYEHDEKAEDGSENKVSENHSLSIEERLAIAEEIKANNASKIEEPVIYQPQEGVKCSSCGHDNVQLVECSQCHKLICGDCVTDTLDGKSLCPDCYENSDDSYDFS